MYKNRANLTTNANLFRRFHRPTIEARNETASVTSKCRSIYAHWRTFPSIYILCIKNNYMCICMYIHAIIVIFVCSECSGEELSASTFDLMTAVVPVYWPIHNASDF